MAILPLPQQIQQYQQQQALNRDQDFFTGLLKHGMNVGEFDMINDEPVFSPGESMPDKTQAWNAFIATKKGRMTPQDLMQFESSYESTKQLRTQNQIKELNKLNLQGANASDIQGMVEDDSQLYQNLLDMVTELQASGTEEGMTMAAQAMQYLPDKSPGMLKRLGEKIGEHPFIATAVGVGAYKGGKYAIDKWGKGLGEKYLTDPVAIENYKSELAKGFDYDPKTGKWTTNKAFTHTFKKDGKTYTRKLKKGQTIGKGQLINAELERLRKSSIQRSGKNLIQKGPGGRLSFAAYFAPTIAGALGAGEETQKFVNVAAGGTIGASALKRFTAASAARHGAGAWAGPYGQVALGLLDLWMAYDMLSKADIL